jgi:hypothetical protein
MEKEKTLITCIIGSTVREVIKQAQELEIKREDIVSMFPLGGQIYLVFISKNNWHYGREEDKRTSVQ